ncbi:MAG: interphotoreceptor retinoid-binding protein [Hyphococcus sp.]|nr:MAG: interphotoreceptor retinoid-binding protein [Marinicaulis sp.]
MSARSIKGVPMAIQHKLQFPAALKVFFSRPVPGILLLAGMVSCSNLSAVEIEDRAAVIENLAEVLEDNFVFPDIGAQYGAYLRSREFPESDAKKAQAEFAANLTAELQAVHRDAHLRIFPPSIEENDAAGEEPKPDVPKITAIEAAQWLTPEVAYIRFNLFPGDAGTLSAVEKFVSEYASTKVLIIDVRGHRGGGLAEMDILFSDLFTEQTDLLYMETRKIVDELGGSPIVDGATVRTIPGPESVVRRKHMAIPRPNSRLGDTKLYILASGYTASAAEHLVLSVKRTGRGVVVGEQTRGGAHYGGTIDIGAGYAAFVPVGRTFDPETGKDWEGSGVAPTMAVDATQALRAALVDIGLSEIRAEQIDHDLGYAPPPSPIR